MLENVGGLPVEVVFGDVDEGFGFAVGVSCGDLHGGAAGVHVGLEGEKLDGAGDGHGGVGDEIGGLRGDEEVEIAEGIDGEDAVLGRGWGEVEGELGVVDGGFAVGVEVHLEDEVGAGGEEFGAVFEPGHGGVAGFVAEQELAAVEDFLAFVAFAALGDGGDEEFVGGEAGEIGGAGGTDEGVDVVDDGALVDFEFGGADPGVLFEIEGDDEEGVGELAGGGDLVAGDGE